MARYVDEERRVMWEDAEAEARTLAVSQRLSNGISKTLEWKAYLSECGMAVNDGIPDGLWSSVVHLGLRYLITFEAVEGRAATLDDVSEWVAGLAPARSRPDPVRARALAYDFVVRGLLNDGEGAKVFVAQDGRFQEVYAPNIVEAHGGSYPVTSDALDYAYRNVEYERNYSEVFDLRLTRAREHLSRRQYDPLERDVREMNRIISRVKKDYERILEEGLSLSDAEGYERLLADLRSMMGSAAQRDRLVEIEEQVALSAADMCAANDEPEIGSKVTQLRSIRKQVRKAAEGIGELIALRRQAQEALKEASLSTMRITLSGESLDLRMLLDRALRGQGTVAALCDATIGRVEAPPPPAGLFGPWTLISAIRSTRERKDDGGFISLNEIEGGSAPLPELTASFFDLCDAICERSEGGAVRRMRISELVEGADEQRLFRWLTDQSLRYLICEGMISAELDTKREGVGVVFDAPTLETWATSRDQVPWFTHLSMSPLPDARCQAVALRVDGGAEAVLEYDDMEVSLW